LEEVLNTASEVFITRIRLENDARILADAINNMEIMTRDAKFPNVTENLLLISQKCEELELELIKETGTTKNTTSRSRRVLDRITKLLKDEVFQNLDRLPEESRLNLLRIEEARKQLQKNIEDLEGLSGTLQTGAMGFRMVPISQLFNRFPPKLEN
jgi:chemotaxis protein histidine kinase CheA